MMEYHSSHETTGISIFFKKKNGGPAHILQSMLTLYRIAFAPARKSYQIGFLLTHKNGNFGAISVIDRSCGSADLKGVQP